MFFVHVGARDEVRIKLCVQAVEEPDVVQV